MALQQAGLKWVNDGLGGFIGGVGQANRAMQGVGDGTEGVSNKFSLLSGVVMGVASSITTFLLDAFGKASKAMVKLVTDSVGMAQQFESASMRLQIAGRGAATQAGIALDDLSEAAIKVGGDTRLMGVSAMDSAEALTDLLKAGLSVNDVMGDFNGYMNEGAELGGVLGASIRLAAASELNMVDASNLASTTMTIFGLEAKDVAGAMDYIVRGADASVASVADIRDALSGAGPTLRSFGFSLEDSVDALSLLSNAGITGAEAGTALRSAWIQLTSDKKKVTSVFEQWGITMTDATTGSFLPFKEILGQIQVATEQMTEAERSGFLQTVAGAYGRTALTALVTQGVEAYDKYSASVENAAGIEFQSATMANTAAAAQEALQGNLETLSIRLGSVFLPVWTQVMKGVAQAVDMLGPKLEPVLETVGQMFTTIADSMGLFLDLIGEGADPMMAFDYVLRKTFGADTANQVKEVIATVVEKVGNIRTTFENVKSWIETNWPPVRDTIINVFGMVKDWIVANWPGIRDTVVEVFGKVTEAFNNVKTWVETNWPSIRDTIVEVFGKVMEVFNNVKAWVDQNWPTIQAVVLTAWRVIGDIISSVIDTIKPAIESLQKAFGSINPDTAGNAFKRFGDVVKGVAAVIGALLVAAIAVVTGVINTLIVIIEEIVESAQWFAETWDEIADAFRKGNIKKGFKKFGDLLIGAFIAPIKLIVRAVSTFVDSIIKFFKNLSDKLVGRSIIPDMMKAIFSVIDKTLDNIIRIVNIWVKAVIKFFEDLGKSILQIWDSLWSAVEKALDSAISAITKIVKDFISAVEKLWNDFKSTLETLWTNLWDNIKSTITLAWSNIVTAVATGLNNIIAKINEYAAQLIQKGRDIVDNIKNGLEEQWSVFIAALQTKLGEIATAIGDKAGELIQAGRDIVTSLKDGFVEWWTNPDGLIETIKTKFKNISTDIKEVWIWVQGVGGDIIENIRKGLEATWNNVVDALKDAIENDQTGILAAVVGAAIKLKDAGKRILDYIKEGVLDNWNAFKEWIRNLFGIIFGNSEPKDQTSAFSSKFLKPRGERAGKILAESFQSGFGSVMSDIVMPGMPGMPAYAGNYTRDVNNSRSVVVEVNANYANAQSEASIYYDVVAALSGARI